MTTCWGAPRRAWDPQHNGGREVIVVVIELGVQPGLVARLARKFTDPVLRRPKGDTMSDRACLR